MNHEGSPVDRRGVEYLAEVGNAPRLCRPDRPGARRWPRGSPRSHASRDGDRSTRFLSGARGPAAVRLCGIDASRAPRTSGRRRSRFAVGEQHPLETAKLLGERGIFVWDGHYYAVEVMERLGLLETGGAVRIGFCHYNTAGEVDRVLEEARRARADRSGCSRRSGDR